MFKATKEFKWDMAHRLPTHGGKCWNVHGHTYRALITIKGEQLQEEGEETGMLRDFGNFKPIKEWIDENWDHAYVGERDDDVTQYLQARGFKVFEMGLPTAENMSCLLYEKARELITGVNVDKVIIYETPTSFAEYSDTNDLPF